MKSKHKVAYIFYTPLLGFLFIVSLLFFIIEVLVISGLMLLILIFSLVGDIKKDKFKKKKETDPLYSSQTTKEPQDIWTYLSMITAVLLFFSFLLLRPS